MLPGPWLLALGPMALGFRDRYLGNQIEWLDNRVDIRYKM